MMTQSSRAPAFRAAYSNNLFRSLLARGRRRRLLRNIRPSEPLALRPGAFGGAESNLPTAATHSSGRAARAKRVSGRARPAPSICRVSLWFIIVFMAF